jgi:methyl-accepting chemotaxis protein
MMTGVAAELKDAAQRVGAYDATVDVVRTASTELAGQMTMLLELARQATAMVGQIEGVARETRILSINASLEATRAGTQGAAFGVVATAVKSLAEGTNAAAQRIAHTLQQMVVAATSAAGNSRALDGSLNALQATSHQFARSLGEQAQVSTEAAKYSDEAVAQVERMSSSLTEDERHVAHGVE